MADWEEFYASYSPPSNFEEIKLKIATFIKKHADIKIALVTSGGTTVPMELNTVRFVDNFSAGTRGSASTEYFLASGYAVIFLYRLKSMEPFVRHFTGQKFLNTLNVLDEIPRKPKIQVSNNYVSRMLPLLRGYQLAMSSGRLLSIDFTTLSDYLWLLREACLQLAPVGSRALVYLAAAVSDFYIPADEMPEHKLQSGHQPLVMTLKLVPKMLRPLVLEWVPNAFVVSFKLETDPEILISKAKDALQKYKHKLVIGNMLHTRKHQVIMVEPETHYNITMTDLEIALGIEIEEKIIEDLVQRHDFILEQ
uniref:DNA/pantothenate metabolism flavoprotein C-terminal domain-containing protein n=1 Tax=Graphocephala atropunctata TaxID=36148 RepID=A0A1B6L3S7_9HEMI